MSAEAWVELAHAATDGLDFRRRVLARLGEHLPWDVAMFHALSPRVPLATGVFVGIHPEALRGQSWDGLAVELAPILHGAMARRGVASDSEVIPARGPLRARYTAAFRPFGIHHVVFAHLSFHGDILSVIVLGRTRTRPFGALDWLRDQLPAIALGDAIHHRPVSARPVDPVCRDDRLTPRQNEIVTLLARGHTNREIGEALGLSANTVRNRLADAFARLQVGSRAELVHRASFAAAPARPTD